jgi:uracil-DNA glycosylase
MTARDFLPETRTLASLRGAAAGCRGCPLYERATQTVFGDGPAKAPLLLVGEQPGNEEDQQGRAFVGPAGKLLDRALEEAGIERRDAYVTNVVKHFKWVPSGRRRLHQKPNAREIGACLPWLEEELRLVRPEVLVCLGATAAQALLGRAFRVSAQRGERIESSLAPYVTATVHPSSILRARSDEDRARQMQSFIDDLRKVADVLRANGRRRTRELRRAG